MRLPRRRPPDAAVRDRRPAPADPRPRPRASPARGRRCGRQCRPDAEARARAAQVAPCRPRHPRLQRRRVRAPRSAASLTTMRVGVVDLGTNSTRLLVADVADGRVEEVARRLTITRLGEGVDERRKLLPLPIARVRNVLADYRRELDELGAERVLAVGTSAIRDAENGEAFLGEVEWSYGFVTRMLSGEDEAGLTLRGVANGRVLDDETLVLDVGGGSTELITANARTSLDLGCVRLTERHLRTDPPTPEKLDASARAVREALPELRPRDAIGVAGTVTTLAALDLGLPEYDPQRVHGHRISADRGPRHL